MIETVADVSGTIDGATMATEVGASWVTAPSMQTGQPWALVAAEIVGAAGAARCDIAQLHFAAVAPTTPNWLPACHAAPIQMPWQNAHRKASGIPMRRRQ